MEELIMMWCVRNEKEMNLRTDIGPGAQILSWLLVSNIIKSLVQWAVLIILVKYFAEEEVGMFTYATAYAAPFFLLSDMQLKSVLVVEPSGDNDHIYTYFYIRIITVVLTIVGLLSYFFIYNKINLIIVAVVSYKACESLLDILYGYFQKTDRMRQMALFDIIKNVVSLSGCLTVTVILNRVELSLFALVLISILFAAINFIYIRTNYLHGESRTTSPTLFFDIIKKSLPLGMSVFFSSYITNYPRIVMEEYCGLETLAFFGAYSYLVIGLFQINVPIQTFLRQRLSTAYHTDNKKKFMDLIRKTLFFYVFIGLVFLAVFLLVGVYIIHFLYQDSYVDSSDVIPIMIISQLMMSLSGLFAVAVLSFNIYTKQLFISGLVLLVVLVISLYLIPDYGIYGGAYTGLIAALLSLSCYTYIFTKKIKGWGV